MILRVFSQNFRKNTAFAALFFAGACTTSTDNTLNFHGADNGPVNNRPVSAKTNPPIELAQANIRQSQQLSPDAQDWLLKKTGSPEDKKAMSSLISGSIASPTRSFRPSIHSRYKIFPASFGDADPVKFSVAKPKYYRVHGVDVSRWQYDIDWRKLRRQGANFAYIKATEGDDHLDPNFKKNWTEAARAGIPRGAYHFFYWCGTGSAQADWFIRNVPKVTGALPPVIDVEWNHVSKTCRKKPARSHVLAKMKAFMKKIEAHYGQKPVIYTAPDFYKDNLVGEFENYSYWLRAVAQHPSKVYPGQKWAFWQYSGTGKSRGVDTHIDLNVFNGSEDSWRRWLQARTH